MWIPECDSLLRKLEFSADRTIVSDKDGQTRQPDGSWQTAGQRALLYLRGLNLPEPQALELTLAALKAARLNSKRGPGNSPLAETMEQVRLILSRPNAGAARRSQFIAGRCGPLVPSTPPLHRLPMVPEEMASAQWHTLLKNLLSRLRPRSWGA